MGGGGERPGDKLGLFNTTTVFSHSFLVTIRACERKVRGWQHGRWRKGCFTMGWGWRQCVRVCAWGSVCVCKRLGAAGDTLQWLISPMCHFCHRQLYREANGSATALQQRQGGASSLERRVLCPFPVPISTPYTLTFVWTCPEVC